MPFPEFTFHENTEHDEHPHTAVPLWANVITLSHVCRYWRDLMLDLPRLWTFIRVTGSFSNRLMFNEMITRSGGFPLSILLTYQVPGNDRSIFDLLGLTSVVCDHSERIQELGVLVRVPHAGLILDCISKQTLPCLEKLWLDTDPTPGVVRVWPVTLFDNTIPPLRSLHINDIVIAWLPFEGLTQLELTCRTSPPLHALLHTLRQSPLLEILTLHMVPADDNDDDPPTIDEPTAVLLPCLRRLQLYVGSLYCAAFSVLPHLTFPPSTAVGLKFSGRFGYSLYEDCASLMAIACNVEHATFALDDNRACLVSRDPPLKIEYEVAMFDAEEPAHGTWDPSHARLCEGFLAVPLPALRSLSMSIFVNPRGLLVHSDGRFVPLFQAVPSIERLRVEVRPEEATPVFTALKTVVLKHGQPAVQGNVGQNENESENKKEDVLCPRLQELAVTWQNEPSVDDFWNLERCCHFRASRGRGLAKLETAAFPMIVQKSLEHSVPWVVDAGWSEL